MRDAQVDAIKTYLFLKIECQNYPDYVFSLPMGADKKKKFNPISISNEGLETIEYLSVDCTAAEGNTIDYTV